MAQIDHSTARSLLGASLQAAEDAFLRGEAPTVPPVIREACETVFRSSTQSYREALLGCVVARLQDRTVNIRQPYVDQGPNAFSGRSLDENVVNPFLQDARIPCSRGPYLAVFRRRVQFTEATRGGLKDKRGYDAFLTALDYLESLDGEEDLLAFLNFLLFKFVELREAASVPLSRIQRISLEQYGSLVAGLLTTPSGGLFPLLLAVAMFQTIREFYDLDWDISWQGINVADAASRAGGDVTICRGAEVVLAVEVTERPVDRSRVVSTFNTKIGPSAIEDYLFLVGASEPTPDAYSQAAQYFAQGHEVNFARIRDWIVMSLATMGRRGRGLFNQRLMALLDNAGVPQTLRAGWNQQIDALTGV